MKMTMPMKRRIQTQLKLKMKKKRKGKGNIDQNETENENDPGTFREEAFAIVARQLGNFVGGALCEFRNSSKSSTSLSSLLPSGSKSFSWISPSSLSGSSIPSPPSHCPQLVTEV
jgi:hypothetical protein